MHPKAQANLATLTANIVGSHNTVLTRAQKKKKTGKEEDGANIKC
jgi:hypothetical protein